MGPRADGSAAYICIAAITRNTGLFPCPPSPVLSPCPPHNFPPYLPRSIPRTNCHRIWPPFWKNSFIAHSPRTCGTCFSRSARWSSSPCRRRISAAARILGQLWRRLSDRTRLSAAGKGAACTPSTPYSGACCCACSVHFHANSGRPSTAAAATGSRRRTNSFPRWSTITRRAISSGHFRSWNGTWPAIWSRKAPPSSPGSFRIARRRFCPGTPGRRSSTLWPRSPPRTFRPLPTAAAGWRATARRWTRRIPPRPCCAANWKCCWPLRNTTTSQPCPSATAGHGNCWAAPRGCIRRNPPGAWAVPPCCSCSTGKAANSGRKSG